MNSIVIPAPIDFGHTVDGNLAHGGQRLAAEKVARILADLFPSVIRTDPSLSIPTPSHREPQDCPLKFDQEIVSAVKAGASRLEAAIRAGSFPIVTGGDHTISLMTGLGVSRSMRDGPLGAIVFDAHTDFNLPGPISTARDIQKIPMGSTISGNAHGMIHALLGRMASVSFQISKLCHQESRLEPSQVVIIGARAPRYPQLEETLREAKCLLVQPEELRCLSPNERSQRLGEFVEIATNGGKNPFYLSIDFDVLEGSVFPDVATPVEGGLSSEDLQDYLRSILTFVCNRSRNLAAIDLAEISWTDDFVSESVLREILGVLEVFLNQGAAK